MKQREKTIRERLVDAVAPVVHSRADLLAGGMTSREITAAVRSGSLLRLRRDVVVGHDLRCTHFDAFRFFTPDAVGRNRQPLTRGDQPMFEQPGCLHAGMDVYKWAMKLGPLVPGELLLDAFELARDIRQLDMEAAPYDLSEWGVVPVQIETIQGKAEYVRRQRGFAERGNALRHRVLDAWLGAGAPAGR